MDHTGGPDELVLRSNLPSLGMGRRELASAEKHRELVKLRRGVWAAKRPTTRRERHKQDVRAALAARADGAVVSHLSAAAFHGLPLPPKLDAVWLTRPGRKGGGHHRAGIQLVRSPLEHSEWEWQEDLKVTTLARTTVDVARAESFVMGVMVADAALRAGCTREELQAALDRARRWPGMAKARRVVDVADGRSESPYESWMRVLLSELGLGEITPQLVIHDEHGKLVARVDAALEELHLAFEFDGEGKYEELLKPGQRPQHAFRAEKERDRTSTDWAGGCVTTRSSTSMTARAFGGSPSRRWQAPGSWGEAGHDVAPDHARCTALCSSRQVGGAQGATRGATWNGEAAVPQRRTAASVLPRVGAVSARRHPRRRHRSWSEPPSRCTSPGCTPWS